MSRRLRPAATILLSLAVVGFVPNAGRALAAQQAGESTTTDAPANVWGKTRSQPARHPVGSAFVSLEGAGRMFLAGGVPEKGVPYVQCLDLDSMTWSSYSDAVPGKGIHPYFRAAYDSKAKKIYCLSQVPGGYGEFFLPDAQLHSFDLTEKTWNTHDRNSALEDMNWHAMALDPVKRRLVVIGADKRPDNVGWSRTVIYNLESGQWSLLPLPGEAVVKEHKDLVAAKEALIDLIGRTRLAWYRDPQGIGTEAELKALEERSAALAKMPGMARFAAELGGYDKLILGKKTLDALKHARGLQRKIEEFAEVQYPVPPSRRNSPLVYDAKNKCMVLFGGDHEDYVMNDTWILDLEKDAWRRPSPAKAPSPRAGHVLTCLPKSGKIALYGGYVSNSSPSYGFGNIKPISPYQVWIYDVPSDRWAMVTSWVPKQDDTTNPDYCGAHYGYDQDNYSPPAIAADGNDCLVFASAKGIWRLTVDPEKCSQAETEKMAALSNQPEYRQGIFLASYCEDPAQPKDPGIDKLPTNQFVRLPAPPRNVCFGGRSRVWSTSIWDPDRDQILLWGGGHCVHDENPPIQYSPVSGRMVEGYDAQESYSGQGVHGNPTTVLSRPWVSSHTWNMYGYDPTSKMMVTCRGYVYDPSRMDWLRQSPAKPPFSVSSSTLMEQSKHGAVVWSVVDQSSFRPGLWLFSQEKGWSELSKPGESLPVPGVDKGGFVYDSKRDRLLFGDAGPWGKSGKGDITAFHFKDRRVEKLNPANPKLGILTIAREMVYVEHADWVLFGEPYAEGKEDGSLASGSLKKEEHVNYHVRAYDCAKNQWMLLKIDGFPDGHLASHGWIYDPKRELVYVVNSSEWVVWALRLDPKTVKVLAEVPR